MLAYVLDAWAEAADGRRQARRPIVVYSPPTAALIRRPFADRADFALQDEPRGTGDAVRAALAAVPDDAAEILVLSGDVPLVTGADLAAVLEARREDDAAIALASVFAADPARLGRVVRGEFGTVERIVEAKDATDDELAGNEINAGLYAFDAAWLRRRIGVAGAVGRDRRAVPDRPRPARPRGRPDRERRRLRGRRPVRRHQRPLPAGRRPSGACACASTRRHMRDGVTMRDPSTVYLDWDVDARHRRHARAERHPARRDVGRARGASSAPAASSSTRRSGRAARVWASDRRVVDASRTRRRVGPFSHLRPGSVVGRGAEVGNYAELKNTHLGAGSKQHHMSYLGDADRDRWFTAPEAKEYGFIDHVITSARRPPTRAARRAQVTAPHRDGRRTSR